MRGWIERMNWKAQKRMEGRYGQDELYVFLTVASLVFLCLSGVSQGFFILAIVLLFFSLFRCYSRNLEKRRRERKAYLRIVGKPKNAISLQRRKWADRETHCYFKCGGCGQVLRVPKHKGRIVVTCPKCHGENTRKT